MRFVGSLFYDTDEGERHRLSEFDLEAADAAAARMLILDSYWDHRLDSACCVAVIKYADPRTKLDDTRFNAMPGSGGQLG